MKEKIKNLKESYDNFLKNNLFIYIDFAENPLEEWEYEKGNVKNSLIYRILIFLSRFYNENNSDDNLINKDLKVLAYNIGALDEIFINFHDLLFNNMIKQNQKQQKKNKEWLMIIIIFDETNKTLNSTNNNNNNNKSYLPNLYRRIISEKSSLIRNKIFLMPVFCGTQAKDSIQHIQFISSRAPKQISINLITKENYLQILEKLLGEKEKLKFESLPRGIQFLLVNIEGVPRLFEYFLICILKNHHAKRKLFVSKNNKKELSNSQIIQKFIFNDSQDPQNCIALFKSIQKEIKSNVKMISIQTLTYQEPIFKLKLFSYSICSQPIYSNYSFNLKIINDNTNREYIPKSIYDLENDGLIFRKESKENEQSLIILPFIYLDLILKNSNLLPFIFFTKNITNINLKPKVLK
ncbi:inositol transporter 2-related [Anaeramoeba flamelloides]|uniref:Inositol transporter 2-related n=1 Tax=Anaeramoeba flamelloides TaxID=1746091 RepID=A0AAV7YS24_9EUKA|nr:inositol transporter 2-related [Anaeramoeba flamelloides]